MFKQWNVLVLFGLVALVGAFGCAKEEAAAEADSETGEAVGQVQAEDDEPNGPQVSEMMDARGGPE